MLVDSGGSYRVTETGKPERAGEAEVVDRVEEVDSENVDCAKILQNCCGSCFYLKSCYSCWTHVPCSRI